MDEDRGPLRAIYAAMTAFMFLIAFATVVPMLVGMLGRLLDRGDRS